MDERPISPTLKLLAAAMFVFLLAPLLMVLPMSFSADPYLSFPPSGWSTRWYGAIFRDPRMVDAFLLSLGLGLAVAAISLVVGVLAAYALARLELRAAGALLSVFTAPLLLPTIVLGLGLLIVFASFGLLATFGGLLLCHLVVTLPYALRVLVTALESIPASLEEAAATLGASPPAVFFHVTLPMMSPGLVAAAVLSFLVSFDEVVISLFMTGPRLSTLPVAMFHHVEDRADPMVAALSVLLVAFTLVAVLVVERSIGLGKVFVK